LWHVCVFVFYGLLQGAASHTATDKFNVLIVGAPDSATYLSGVIVTPLTPIAMSLNGMPQTARMGRGSELRFQFQVQSTDRVHALLSSYSTTVPVARVLYTPSGAGSGPVALPASYWNEDNDPSEGFLSFTPSTADIGQTFSVELATSNMTYLSLALRLGQGEEQVQTEGAAAKDPPVVGSPTHTVVLLNGQPQRDEVNAAEEHLYVFYVPESISGTVTFSLAPIQVLNYCFTMDTACWLSTFFIVVSCCGFLLF
jgi:hypothetical protein